MNINKQNLNCLTITNSGYQNYTLNLINSILKNKIDLNIEVYCLDKKVYKFFNEYSELVTPVDISNQVNEEIVEFKEQKSVDFYKIVYNKFIAINNSLDRFEYTLFIDGDIVIKKNFIDFFNKIIGENDMLIQDNFNLGRTKKEELNSGFFLLKSNKTTKYLFNPKNIALKKFKKFKVHDQTYINKIKKKLKYEKLPLDYFPNGAHFYRNFQNIDPYIIHFNWIMGEEKIKKMKEYSEWYEN